MKSRKFFVDQVAKSILENHNTSSDSYIFGISGKWGEGKSHFLADLEKELVKLDPLVKVYNVNPWKFNGDKISFLRNFLRILQEDAKDVDIQQLYSDTSTTVFHKKGTLAVVLWSIIFIYWVFIFQFHLYPLSDAFRDFITQTKWIWYTILVPTFFGLASKVVSIQKSNHAVSTVDKFEPLLLDIIDSFGRRCKKIKPVVFVDDLDRVTPEIARDALDNLRTFFDKPEISYVVAGDHTVLERYLGSALQPNADPPEKLEEGRRFMKKIFNVYWRLPIPIDEELNEFLDKELANKSADLSLFFNNDQLVILKAYLADYFEKNFRQIKRFLEIILFNFRIIAQRIEEDSSEQGKYFEELKNNPLLVVRVLMIQEHCAPLFENIATDPKILRELEYAVEKNLSPRIDTALEQARLSVVQTRFIKSFLYREPRFFTNTSLVVSDIRPFLYLAADPSFGDSRGPSKEDFIASISVGDPIPVKNMLVSISNTKAEEAAQGLSESLASNGPDIKLKLFQTLLNAFSDIPNEFEVHSIFGNKLSDTDLTFISILDEASRKEFLQKLWAWIDKLNDSTRKVYLDKFPYKAFTSNYTWIEPSSAGPFTTTIITRWLREYYAHNPNDAINQMLLFFKSTQHIQNVSEELKPLETKLVSDLITDPSEFRDKRLEIVQKYLTNGMNVLKTLVIEKAGELNSDIYNWGKANASEENWSIDQIEDGVLNSLKSKLDFSGLNEVLAFISNHQVSNSDSVWGILTENQMDILINDLPTFMGMSYSHLIPSEKIGRNLLHKAISRLETISDKGQKLQWLEQMTRSKWLWNGMKNQFPAKQLEKNIDITDQDLAQKLKDVVSSWAPEKPPE